MNLVSLQFAASILFLSPPAMMYIKILYQHCLKQKAAINHEIKLSHLHKTTTTTTTLMPPLSLAQQLSLVLQQIDENRAPLADET